MHHQNNPQTYSETLFPFLKKTIEYNQVCIPCKVKWIKLENQISSVDEHNEDILGFVHLKSNFIKIMNQDRSKTLYQFFLNANVHISRASSKKQLVNQGILFKSIKGIKLFLQQQNYQFIIQAIQVGAISKFQEFYQNLILYQIFQCGESEEWYSKKKVLQQNRYYLGEDKKTKRIMLIKAFSIQCLQMNHQVKKSFLTEFYFHKNISHSNIIDLHKAFKTINTYYFVFEKLNYTLKEYIYEFGFPKRQVLSNIIRNIIKAIHFLNNNGISHNNINPTSIILDVNESNDDIITKLSCFEKCRIHKEQESSICPSPLNNEIKNDLRSVGILIIYVDILSKNKKLYTQKIWDQLINNQNISQTELSIQDQDLISFIKKLTNQYNGFVSTQQTLQHPFLTKK